MNKKKVRYLYIALALSLVISAVMVAVGVTNSRTAEAAAGQPSASQTAEASQTANPTPGVTAEATPTPVPFDKVNRIDTVALEDADPTEAPSSTESAAAAPTNDSELSYSEDASLPQQPVVVVDIDAGTADNDSSTYTIENTRFGIDSTGKNARATTDGINAALEWAKAQGYKTIKFVTGTYMVQCNWRDRCIAPTDGILVPSGLTLDLGNSTFMMEPNSYPEYTIFGIVDQSDVTIKNGTLIGDLDNHVYAPSSKSSSHEYGFGICISASNNVLIQGVTIKKMTGDGIIIEGSYSFLSDGGSVSSRIRLLDNEISECRRQGISVIGARNSEIARNKIYGIRGTSPEYGIDVESELDYIIDKLKIHDNVIYDCAGGAISCNKGTDYEVYNNVCSGNILAVFSSNVRIYNNTIKNSFIEVMRGASNITVENNIMEGDSWVQID